MDLIAIYIIFIVIFKKQQQTKKIHSLYESTHTGRLVIKMFPVLHLIELI